MKVITTTHSEIGYTNNVAIVEEALKTHFGFDDNSHVLTAVAAHIWCVLSHGACSPYPKRWGSVEVKHALDCIRARLADLDDALGRIEPEVAPLRLTALIRQHTCGQTDCGCDVALVEKGADETGDPLAVLDGQNSIDTAKRMLTAINGRVPQTQMFRQAG